ncbi:MAG: hypothetical protein ACRCTQ_04870 [Brevinemataceae bacterium]
MKVLLLAVIFLFFPVNANSLIIKDPVLKPDKSLPKGQSTNLSQDNYMYNPLSIYVPTVEYLSHLSGKKVLDMGASTYAYSFKWKALYFYTNAINIFADDPEISSWAHYESGYIYFHRKQYHKALEFFDKILEIKGAPLAAQALAKFMGNRVRNIKDYKILIKQEDLLFLEDKRANALRDKQIAKEEKVADKLRRQLAKERKATEKKERLEKKKQAKATEKEKNML